MRAKLSPKLVEHLKAPGPKRLDVWDTVLQCFGVRISLTGRKTWFVVVRTDGRQKRVTIGTYPAFSLAEARGEARKIIRDAQLGVLADLHESPALTLGETVLLFIQLYAKPKNRGWRESERLLGKFQGLFVKPLGQNCPQPVCACLGRNHSLWNAVPREPRPRFSSASLITGRAGAPPRMSPAPIRGSTSH
jgi:hypothetical protein